MEKVSYEIIRKGRELSDSGKVKKDIDSERRTYFTVEGDTQNHSVIFEKGKKEWKCDCKYQSLHNRNCSHVLACMIKECLI